MASLPLSSTTTTLSQFSPRPRTFFVTPPHFPPRTTRTHRLNVSCKAKDEEETSHSKFDRRNLLLGMGGVYGAASTLVSADSPAFATPISGPDFSKCTRGTNRFTNQPLTDDCCPPKTQDIVNYELPPVTKMRVRPAAHLVTEEYVTKYEKAVELMKALPNNDPRNFMQQANVHCAYCNLTYEQKGDPELKLQVHECWHFYPWHRWYLYFYEKILGKLIDDPNFALPFWNWDNPDGMLIPNMFLNNNSPLFDEKRNQEHLPPSIADLNYAANPTTDPSKIITNNLTEMYGEMVRNASKLEDFYGAKYVVGTHPDPGAGTIERGSHTALHVWVGDPRQPSGEDMGNFYSAGRDSIFFSHHANIDRLWSIWRGLRGSKPKDFKETDWRDANFLFYDENARLVRVYVRDTVENEKMGYTNQKVDIPWLKNRPKARVKKSKIATRTEAPKASMATIYPIKLDKVARVLVDRPKRRRSKKEKKTEEELLVIEGIEVDAAKFVRFEVYVNDEDDKPGEIIDKAEYAGCYAKVPHKNSTRVKSKIRLGLTELLEDLDAEDDEKILVSLVPKAGGEDITIGGNVESRSSMFLDG